MSNVVEQEVPTDTAPVESQEQTVDVEALMSEIEKLKNTNIRLLDESKANKGKYQTLRTEVDTKNQTDLESNENWKELLDIEKNKNHETSSKMKDMKQKVMQANLHAEVAKNAGNAFDVNDVINSLSKDLLQVNDENLRIEGIKEAVEDVRTRKPHLFNTGVKPHGQDGGPPAQDKVEVKEQTLNEILALGVKHKLI